MPRSVVLLDILGVVGNGNSDVLARHQEYADTLKLRTSSQTNFVILTTGNKKYESHSLKSLEIIRIPVKRWNVPGFVTKAYQTIKAQNIFVALLIVGDPWESLWSAKLLRLLLKWKPSIQVQIHGDIGNRSWKYLNPRNYLRSRFVFLNARSISTIRCTTQKQKEEIVESYNVNQQIIRVIPVTLNISSINKVVQKKHSKVLSLGFIGRLHDDRGLEIFLDIIRTINEKSRSFEVVVAGSGPKEEFLKSELTKILGEKRFNFLGELDKFSMGTAWEQINVLVSTAPAESYGRTIREALFHGIGVLGVPSNGLLSLEFERSAGLVEIIEKPLNSGRLLDQVLRLSKHEGINEYQEKVLQRDSMMLTYLVETWIDSITPEKLQ